MDHLLRGRRLRCFAVWLGVTGATALAAVALLPVELSWSGSFDELLVRLASWALLGCATWFWAVTTAVIGAAFASASPAARMRGIPAPVRRLVLAACGLALSSGAVAPALATPGPVRLGHEDHSGRVVLTGLPFPDRATADALRVLHRSASAAPATQRVPARDGQVVVRAGDSLWSIAAARLPADATDAEIAAAWHRLYHLNRAAIGDDPDLLTPGQHLVLPPVLG